MRFVFVVNKQSDGTFLSRKKIEEWAIFEIDRQIDRCAGVVSPNTIRWEGVQYSKVVRTQFQPTL